MSILINHKAPKPVASGMDPESELQPGEPPPWVIPHCRSCGLPVEQFTVDWVSTPDKLPIQWICCGRSGGYYIPRDEVLYKSKNGGIVWVNDVTPRSKPNGR